jgi:hypothetical protein
VSVLSDKYENIKWFTGAIYYYETDSALGISADHAILQQMLNQQTAHTKNEEHTGFKSEVKPLGDLMQFRIWFMCVPESDKWNGAIKFLVQQ